MRERDISRRGFCGGALAFAAGMGLRPVFAAPERRWYKGMLHCHTHWSDGHAFPEQAARAYRDAGYNFLCISDHNRFAANLDFWRDVCELEGGWPPNVWQPIFNSYRNEFPDADVRERDGRTQVRLKTFEEVRSKFEVPGRFLMLPGMEVTRATYGSGSLQIHMNYVNIAAGLPSAERGDLIQAYGSRVVDIVSKTRSEVETLARETGGSPHLLFVNHPHWCFFDVVPQDVISNPEVRFFEICNCGADLPLQEGMTAEDFSCDRFWDIVLAFRCRDGQPLLYGIGSDDAHWYPNTGTPKDPMPFEDAYVQVRAEDLSSEALIAAMDRGDFYASSGVDLEEVRFEGAANRLSVSVAAKAGVSYRVKFVGTKKGFDPSVARWVDFPGTASLCARRLPVYSRTIGVTLKTVEAAAGERVDASYEMVDDDLYVRAIVESSEPGTPYALAGYCRPHVKMAWTQPWRNAKSFDSFEDYAIGQAAGTLFGWTGVGQVVQDAVRMPDPPTAPLNAAPHEKTLRVSGAASRAWGDGMKGSRTLDLLVQVRRREELPTEGEMIDRRQVGVTVNPDGWFCVYRPDADGRGRWVPLSFGTHSAFAEGEWVRLTMVLDYHTNPDGRAFGQVRVNGSCGIPWDIRQNCPAEGCVRRPDDLTPGGSWFALFDVAARAKGVSLLQVAGELEIDDVVLGRLSEGERAAFDMGSVTAANHVGRRACGTISFSTLDDTWGLPRDTQVDTDGDGYSNGDEILRQSDPFDPNSRPTGTIVIVR